MHILLSMLIIAAAIATVAVSGIAMWLYWRRQTQSLRPTLRLELRNDGNVPGRYELKAEDPTGSLHFVWRLNGTPLGMREVRGPTTAPLLSARPTVAHSAIGEMYSGNTVAQVLPSIGYRLLRMVVGPFVSLSSQVLYGQQPAEGVHSMPDRLWHAIPGAHKVKAYGADMIQPARLASTVSSATGSVYSTPLPRSAEIWAQTPSIPPSGALSLDLTIEPIHARHYQQYSFKVISKSVEQPDRLVSENGVVRIQGMSTAQRLLPLLMFAGIALLTFACSSLLLANIRILGI